MRERTLVAGAGGQGAILIGRLLATVAVDTMPHVTFFPAYGAEVRGGTSNCHVILSSEEIASPVSEEFDAMLIMNQPSAEKFLPRLAVNGLAIINSSMCKTALRPGTVEVKATDLANKIGDTRVANFVMLGAYVASKQLLTTSDIEKGIRKLLSGKPRSLIDLDIRALRTGLSVGSNSNP